MKLFSRTELKAREQTKLNIVRQEELKINQALQEKITKLNTFNLEMDAQIKNKKAELLEAQIAFQDFVRSKTRIVEGLEERKREALSPLTRELEELEAKKLEVRKELDLLELKELEDTKRKEHLSTQEAVFKIHEGKTLKELAETKQKLDQREKEIGDREELSRASLASAQQVLNHAKEREAIAIQGLEELGARERAHNLAVIALRESERALDDKEKRLQSLEARLKASWKEIKSYVKR